jgi:methionyl-tRNA formyltransferase
LRLVFAGTPDFAASSLQALIEAGHTLAAVYTQPDRPAGRGRKAQASPVKQLALSHDLPIEQPESLKTAEAQARLAGYKADAMIVAAYGLLLPPRVLSLPRLGCINVHASLLPRWRGAAPIQRAIAAGDRETGITIMQMDEGLDTGAMLLTRATPIQDDDTGGSLHDRLAQVGGEALIDALWALERNELVPQAQDERLAVYARKLNKAEAAVDWTRPAVEIERQIRAFNPWPVAYTDDGDQRIRLLNARVMPAANAADPGTVIARERDGIVVQCGQDTLSLTRLQLPGGRPQSNTDVINGGKPVLHQGTQLQ